MNLLWNYSTLKPSVKPEAGDFEIRAAALRQGPRVRLRYELRGPLESLRIPAPGSIPDDELWRRTCFELFVRSPGQEAYWEWNFSPSTKVNCFRFNTYRTRDAYPVSGSKGIAKMESRAESTALYVMEITLESPGSPLLEWHFATGAPLEASFTAILEDTQGRLSYWALTHPAPKPDFHDARGFVARL